MSLVETTSAERKLATTVDPNVTHNLAISDRAGGISFVSMEEVMNFAKLMALSSVAVPKHLRGNPGACLAVCIQALEWQMSPYAVANKSYSVNDRLSYEAQLVEAVILRRAPIKGRPKIEYSGDGEARVCKIWAELRDEPGEIVSYESPKFGKITPKNSPLWKGDPDQQHFYYSVRAWCRRHFPDVLLGVYARDEIEDNPHLAAAVGVAERPAPRSLGDKLEALAKKPDHDRHTGEIIEHESTEPAPGVPQPETEAGASPPKDAPADESHPELRNPAGGTIPADEGKASGAAPATGDRPVGAAPTDKGPVAIARERGAQARRDGYQRKALPPEFRDDDRIAEADAWTEGWVAEDARVKAEAQAQKAQPAAGGR